MERAVHLLVLDDDERRRTQTAATLADAHPEWSLSVESTVTDGQAILEDQQVDCVVSAATLGDDDCLTALQRIRSDHAALPFVLYDADVAEPTVQDLYRITATDYVPAVEGAESVLAERVAQLVDTEFDESTADDTTDREELARERERFSDLFSNFPEPTIAYGFQNGETVFKSVNDAFEAVFDLGEDDILDNSVNETIVPNDCHPESEEIDNQVDAGDMVDRVVTRLAADERRIFNLRSIPVRAPGEIDGFAVYSDITERKRREQELERYETIVQTIPMGVVTVDEDWEIGSINAQGAEILGYDVSDLVGEPFTKLQVDGVITDDEQALAQNVIASLGEDTAPDKDVVESTITPEPDVERDLEIHISLLPAESEQNGVVLVFHDITERKENERQLRRQNDRLEEFASIVSHDLRNPLNVALGHLEIIEMEVEHDSIDRVANALNRMQTLINETLELAKRGQTVTETQPIRLSEVIDDCWGMVDQADAAIERDGEIRFRGDLSRVKQLFENLFRNSIEHGGESVQIRVGVEESTIVVADDGPGIPPEDREAVFDAGHTSSDDGTGFGLAIVAEIVDAHDWRIEVTESASGGARFEISDFETVRQD
jgi:PAS domain S-box-containing protein